MFKASFFLALLIGFVSCTEKKTEPQAHTARSVQAEANEDFAAVLSGKKPVHAVPDTEKPDLADGGTSFYRGNGYSLTVKSTLAEKNGIHGYMYGPIISFDRSDANPKDLSDVRFYSASELKSLRGY